MTLNGGVLASSASGSISGTVIGGSAANMIEPGDGGVGTLTVGGLATYANTTLAFNLGCGGNSIPLTVVGLTGNSARPGHHRRRSPCPELLQDPHQRQHLALYGEQFRRPGHFLWLRLYHRPQSRSRLYRPGGCERPERDREPDFSDGRGGNTATFTATASGFPSPTVQWKVSTNGGATFSAISGATSTTYSFTVGTLDNSYECEAVFANSAGTATTTAATSTVQIAPAVTANPTSQTVDAGENVTFTAASGGNPSPSVQWKVSTDGGTTFSAISGATSTTYSFAAILSENGYEYEAVFSSVAGSATTTAASLGVQTPPAVTTNPANQTTMWAATRPSPRQPSVIPVPPCCGR